MGVHTGDSITVAPAMTLTDREYQRLRDAARAVMHEIGVETGGSNVQFAVDPKTGRVLVIEMNPRVSRSSALASKATGYPIAKIAAKLAVGFTLDELENDITGTSAAFEPTIDYVVVKWPRFAFEKFPGADPRLGTQMKSVGEVMSIGRTFPEALQKAARSLETGKSAVRQPAGPRRLSAARRRAARRRAISRTKRRRCRSRGRRCRRRRPSELERALERVIGSADGRAPVLRRRRAARRASRSSACTPKPRSIPGFCARSSASCATRRRIKKAPELDRGLASARASASASATRRSPRCAGSSEERGPSAAQAARRARRLRPRRHLRRRVRGANAVSLLDLRDARASPRSATRPKVIILGGGPNRIGQGIEFDYCCCHAVFALRELGIETIMVNCNPETVSTDYDTSDRLYFEPLTLEDVLAICEEEAQKGELLGVIVQFGGQTPLKLSVPLERAGVKLLGTPADAIDRAEDRERFDALLTKLGFIAARAPASPRASTRRARSRATSATRCWCGRRTCSAAAR